MDGYQTIKQQLYSIPAAERTLERIKDVIFYAEQMHMPAQVAPLTKGMLIYRARPQDSTTRRSLKHQMSFQPNPDKTEQGRGNLAKNPVFYGSVRSQEVGHGWFLACNEVAEKVYPPCQTFGVSVWRVKKDLPVMLLSTRKEQASGMDIARRAYRDFLELIKGVPAEQYRRAVELFDCLGEEFSKEVDRPEDYWISAAFAHLVYCNFAGGISYPSVANHFMGYNVCIHPDLIEDHLDLVGGQLIQYQVGDDQTYVGNYEMFDGNTEPFVWNPMDPKYSMGRPWMDHNYPHK